MSFYGRGALLPGLVLLVVAAPGAAKEGTVARPELAVESYTLANGMRVALVQDKRVPKVAVNLLVRTGAAHDPLGKSGFAHLFEHMVFQGSKHITKDAQDRIFVSIGASDEASTNFDWTQFDMVAPANQLETVLWLESDRFGFLESGITEEHLANQRDVVQAERRQRTESTPYGVADERLIQLIFPEPHPYAGYIIGSKEDIQRATVDDVVGFYRENYVPANASLVIAGSFDREKAKAWVERYFGSLPSRPSPALPARSQVQSPPVTEIRETLIADVPGERVSIGWVVAPAFEDVSPEFTLLASILGNGKSSELSRALVFDQKLAQEVNCHYEPLLLGSLFSCDIYVAPGASSDEAIAAFGTVLRNIGEEGPRVAAIARARTLWKSDLVRRVEALNARALLVNKYMFYMGRPDALDTEWDRFHEVAAADIKKVAAKWLDHKHRAIVLISPGVKP